MSSPACYLVTRKDVGKKKIKNLRLHLNTENKFVLFVCLTLLLVRMLQQAALEIINSLKVHVT